MPQQIDGKPGAETQAATRRWEYVGIGRFSMFGGLGGGAMIAVLIAKIVGALSRCAADAETGAPCNWFTYMVFGAIAGAFLAPAVSIWFFRRGRSRETNERG